MAEGPKDREVPKSKKVSGKGKMSAKKESRGASTKGVNADKGMNTKDEPIEHKSAYRGRAVGAVESGLPRQESSFQNRDRQGSGLENEPTYQRKLKSYPKKSPLKKSGENNED